MTVEMSLLEYLWVKSRCNDISGLKFLKPPGRARLLHRLEEIRPDEVSLSDWNDALDYLVGMPPAKSRIEAKRQLIRHLKGKRLKMR